MADITFSVEISDLKNNELDGAEKDLEALVEKAFGTNTSVWETNRDEDEEEE